MVPPRFDRAVAHGLYTGTIRSLLHLLKYEGVEPVAARLGALLAAHVLAQPALPGKLVLVPVPLFGGKRRERGYNQAELLAEAAARAARVRGADWQVDVGLLKRKRATESQAGLTMRQRRDNVRGAFFVPGSRRDEEVRVPGARPSAAMQRLAGKDVLLIDDIYTTGATARACSLALREAGAGSVWVATVARAQKVDTLPAFVLPIEQDVATWGAAPLPAARQTSSKSSVNTVS